MNEKKLSMEELAQSQDKIENDSSTDRQNTTAPVPALAPTRRHHSKGLDALKSRENDAHKLGAMAPREHIDDLEEGWMNSRKQRSQLKNENDLNDGLSRGEQTEELDEKKEKLQIAPPFSPQPKVNVARHAISDRQGNHLNKTGKKLQLAPPGRRQATEDVIEVRDAAHSISLWGHMESDELSEGTSQRSESSRSLGQPGAHHVPGISATDQPDDETTAGDTTTSGHVSTPALPNTDVFAHAHVVEPGEVFDAEEIQDRPKRGFSALSLKIRVSIIASAILVFVGLIVGLVLGLRNNSDPVLVTSSPTFSPQPSSAPSRSPTSLPTPFPTLTPIPANWTQVGEDLPAEANGDRFGGFVALSANSSILAVGVRNDLPQDLDTGAVRVYQNMEGIWSRLGGDIIGKTPGSRFGNAIALSDDGNVIAVGARRDSNNNSTDSGQVRVFRLVNNEWTPIGDAFLGRGERDFFGRSVALSADGTVMAGGSNGGDYTSVYQFQNQTWDKLGLDIAGDAESISLSKNGTILAVGDDNKEQVRVFRLVDNEWSLIGTAINNTGDFGRSVSLSADGTIFAAGAFRGNYAAVYRLETTGNESWIQVGSKLRGANQGDRFGDSVSLSDDGAVLAVGATRNSVRSGQVRMFRLENGEWAPLGDPINGRNEGDELGTVVALSGDGRVVAGGADVGDYVLVYRLED